MRNSFLFLMIIFIFNVIQLFSDTLTLVTPYGDNAVIVRDEYGVPHIYADNKNSLFFAMGFAQAYDRPIQLALYRLNAMGRLSELQAVYSEKFLNSDIDTRKYNYTKEEMNTLLKNTSTEFQDMLASYSEGINRYLDSAEKNPSKYKHQLAALLEFYGIKFEKWEPIHSAYIMVVFARVFGKFGGNELYNEIMYKSLGKDGFDKDFPINDENAYSTIEDGTIGSVKRDYNYSNNNLNNQIINNLIKDKAEILEVRKKLGIPLKLGSFAVLFSDKKTDDASFMMLGCPQMGLITQDEKAPVSEVELTSGDYHVGGIAVTGTPTIIIGRNDYYSWTFTSGYSDNTDTYIYDCSDNNLTDYLFNGEYKKFDVISDTILISEVKGNGIVYNKYPVTFKRSEHGPIYYEDEGNNKAASHKMTFWKQELSMFEELLDLHKVQNLEQFKDALRSGAMSFNAFFSQYGKIFYKHSGKYPVRPENSDPRLPLKGDGSQEWTGFIDFNNLPEQENPSNGYFINWNNKPAKWWDNGDNIAWTSKSHVGTVVNKIKTAVNQKAKMNFDDLKNVPVQINDNGTYQQALRFTETNVIDENLLPASQSEFVNTAGTSSPHSNDQWQLYQQNKFKDWIFGKYIINSVNEELLSEIGVYPNPAKNYISIDIEPSEGSVVEIFDMLGVKVISEPIHPMSSSHRMNIEKLSPGVYFIKINCSNGACSIVERFVKI